MEQSMLDDRVIVGQAKVAEEQVQGQAAFDRLNKATAPREQAAAGRQQPRPGRGSEAG